MRNSKYFVSSVRQFVKGFTDNNLYVEMTAGKDFAWAHGHYIESLEDLRDTVYANACAEVQRLGKFDKYGKVELEIITPHFPKGRTDIKICGYIIRKFNKCEGKTITEKYEYGIKLA